MSDLETDILIVGAGLSGAVASKRLTEAGLRVVCIEQGERTDPRSYPGRNQDGELAALGPWHPNPNIRRNAVDDPIDDSSSDMKPMMFNGVGGSTILYGAQWMRLLRSDFRTRTLDGVGDDWPLSYEELEPYYDRVDLDFGVSGQAGDPAMPSRSAFPMPALPIGRVAERVAAAHQRLGWHCWPGSNSINAKPYGGRPACEQLAVCGSGCDIGAKASVDVTHWPSAERHGATLITGSRVVRLTHDRTGRSTGAVFRDRSGVERLVLARATLLAANAIGTPRLLLASDSAMFPHGLGNRSGLVGRRLMMHPFTRAVGLFDEALQSWQGHWGQSIYSLEFAETRCDRGFLRGAKWNLGPSGGPLAAALFPWPGEPLWGEAMHRHVDAWLGRSAVWGIICEDLPDPENRVELSSSARGPGGLPPVCLHYALSDNSRAMLDFNRKRAEESLAAAGAYRTMSLDVLPDFGWHPLGTCRMGTDSGSSVVDPLGAVHDVPGLYVIDGSQFVTGSCVNPAATIAALALRTADHLMATRSGRRAT